MKAVKVVWRSAGGPVIPALLLSIYRTWAIIKMNVPSAGILFQHGANISSEAKSIASNVRQ